MIKVGFDTRVLRGPSGVRGIGKYASQLLTALKKNHEIRVVELGKEAMPVDLIHYPFFDFFFLTLPLIKKKPTVVTIHDCTPLVFPEKYPAGIKGKVKFLIQKTALRNVSAVIADSENSKKDIIRFLGVPENKIYVIYLAADSRFRKLPTVNKQLLVKYDLPPKFALYVGDVNYNKNLPNLIRAFASLKRKDFYLVLVGKAFENKSLPEIKDLLFLINKLNLKERVKILGFVEDEDLVGIYNLAQVYVLPSLYEGFGLGILEAMACGCPVLTSKTSSMPEVAGEAAVLVNPYSVNEIAEGIEKIAENRLLRNKLIEKGLLRAKSFSWEKTAHETVEIYQKLYNKGFGLN